LNHIDRPGHRIGGHRHPAGHGFQVHQTEGVGAAGKYHDVGSRQMIGEVFAEAIAGKRGVRKLLFEFRSLRPVTDHDLAARPGHAQECADVLLHGDASHIGGNGPRQIEKVLAARLENLGVHAALPVGQVVEAVRGELVAQRGGAHHAACCGTVEAAQNAVRSLDGNRKARAQVLRKLGVVGGGEAQSPAYAKTPRAQAQRTFGRDVQRLRRKLQNGALDLLERKQRQADFRVGRAGDAAKITRGQGFDLMAEATQPRNRLTQGAHHAVGLRAPGVRDDHDFHARQD